MSLRTREPLPTQAPTWEDYWATVGNETYLYARELIEISSSVRRHFAAHIAWRDEVCLVDGPGNDWVPDPDGWVWRDVDLDWAAAAAAADDWAASSTERRLVNLVLSLVQPTQEYDSAADQTIGTRWFNARDLGDLGSWRNDVAEILARFITGQPPRR